MTQLCDIYNSYQHIDEHHVVQFWTITYKRMAIIIHCKKKGCKDYGQAVYYEEIPGLHGVKRLK